MFDASVWFARATDLSGRPLAGPIGEFCGFFFFHDVLMISGAFAVLFASISVLGTTCSMPSAWLPTPSSHLHRISRLHHRPFQRRSTHLRHLAGLSTHPLGHSSHPLRHYQGRYRQLRDSVSSCLPTTLANTYVAKTLAWSSLIIQQPTLVTKLYTR